MDRRKILLGFGIMAASVSLPKASWAADAKTPADIFTILRSRRSVRAYTDEPVSDSDIKTMLECAMLAPSAADEEPWEFIVIREHGLLEQVAAINPYASFAARAPLAILLCLNQQKEKIKGMGIIDMGTCAENLMLAAAGLGLGSVFTGIFPYKDRMDGFSKLCSLPPYVLPIGLIVIGHPKIEGHHEVDRYNPACVHQNKW